MFTKKAYHSGIVVIRCDGCQSLHLIADNLGWVNDKNINIEDIMREKGETIKKLNVDGLFDLQGIDLSKNLDEKKSEEKIDEKVNENK